MSAMYISFPVLIRIVAIAELLRKSTRKVALLQLFYTVGSKSLSLALGLGNPSLFFWSFLFEAVELQDAMILIPSSSHTAMDTQTCFGGMLTLDDF